MREQHIAEKKARLEAMGGQIDTSDIKKPENPENIDYSEVKMSMWEILQLAQQNISAYQEYLDKLEKTYDDAIAKAEAGSPSPPKKEKKIFAEKKRIIKDD